MKIPIKFNKIGVGAKAIDEANMPLTFKATAPSTVKLNATGSPTTSGLQYRLGTSGGWSPYVIGTEISLDTDKEVQFQNTETTLSLNNNNYVKFVMTGTIEASGNIQSMLNYSESVNSCCYQNLFNGCTSLTKAPELPVTDLTNATYCYARMFYMCTSLTKAPTLPATTLANYCYNNMFQMCYMLTEAPELPATTLAANCYANMFQNCQSLTEAPELPATSLDKYCYQYMFAGCSSLSNVKVGFTEWNTNYTNLWLNNVSSTGTFTKLTALPEEFGSGKIPEGWTVVNSDAVEEPTGKIVGYVITNAGTTNVNGTYDHWDGNTWKDMFGNMLVPNLPSTGQWGLYDAGWGLMYHTTGSDVTSNWVVDSGQLPVPTVTIMYE